MTEIIKRCPGCQQGQLLERENSHNGSHFLGCSRYPDCTHSEPLPAYLELLRQGAVQLPGMEDL